MVCILKIRYNPFLMMSAINKNRHRKKKAARAFTRTHTHEHTHTHLRTHTNAHTYGHTQNDCIKKEKKTKKDKKKHFFSHKCEGCTEYLLTSQ